MKTEKTKARLRATLRAASLSMAAAVALAACRTLPPITDPAYQREERDAREALPFEASLFLAIDPSALPELKAEVLAGLPAREASSIASILKSSRMVYAAYSPPWGAGAEGRQSWYALLSGKYSGAMIKAGLAGSKGVKRSGDWYELPSGVKIAVDRDRRILATNADMRTFLDRLRSPSLRLEKKEGGPHPASLAAQARSGGAIVLAPRPGQGLLSILTGASGDLPMDALTLDIAEEKGKELMSVEFAFQSENSAKAFGPAARIILAAGTRALGLSGPLPELSRDGAKLRAEGIQAKPAELADLIASMGALKK